MNDIPINSYVLIIDDDQEDAFAFKWAFNQAIAGVEIIHYDDPAEAMKFLSSKDQAEELPTLVLLDVNMPGADGFEVLSSIRKSNTVAHVPVLMFSNSDAQQEVRRAYAEGANAHLVKPASMHDLRQMISAMVQFWLRHATLPELAVP